MAPTKRAAKEQMDRVRKVIQALAACVLLLSLGFAPVTDAMTHGPGTVVAEADHAAWHMEQGHHGHGHGHGHHDSADHDHSTSVILPTPLAETHIAPPTIWLTKGLRRTGITRDGPRRPPRAAGFAV